MSTFLDVVELLISNSEAKASYTENPAAFMESHGLESLDSADVADAMSHASNALPLPVSILLEPEEGLDSAAAIDLEASGLRLDREPMYEGVEDVESSNEGEPDPADLDPYGADVPFDADGATSEDVVEDVVDTLDAVDAPSPEGSLAETSLRPAATTQEAVEATTPASLPELTTEDPGDYLTDAPVDVPFLDSVDPLDTLDDTELDSVLDLEDTDPTDHLPDDFDLLD